MTTKVPGVIYPVKLNRISGDTGGANYGINAYMVEESAMQRSRSALIFIQISLLSLLKAM